MRPLQLYHHDTLPDGSEHKWYDWELRERVGEDVLDQQRRAWALRVWHAMVGVLTCGQT